MSTRRIRNGFTLIEMLVVIAIILILSGIVLRATSLVFRNMATGRAHHDLEQLQNALNEFYAEYGNYPPCSFTGYEYEGPDTRVNLAYRTFLANPLYNNPDDPSRFYLDTHDRPEGSWPQGMGGKAIGYRYGLVSYLWPRDLKPRKVGSQIIWEPRGQLHWYDKDTARDTAAKARWYNYLTDVGLGTSNMVRTAVVESVIIYTNTVDSVYDPWGREYQYICSPPYQSYRLWSCGPDQTDGTADDINATSKK